MHAVLYKSRVVDFVAIFAAISVLDWGMAIRFQEAEDDAQHSLRVGDTVLLYVKETNGYVFSELSRYVAPKNRSGINPLLHNFVVAHLQ